MNFSTHPFASPSQLVQALREHPLRWLLPAVAVALLSLGYAGFKSDTWEATQAMVVRNEAAGNHDSIGKFRYPEELKTKQETILELGKSHGVLRGALTKVGAPESYANAAAWPTSEDIVDFSRAVRFTPPKGAELGTTEVFYIRVKDHDRTRAERLAEAVGDELQNALKHLRAERAQSTVDELAQGAALAQTDLNEATARLTRLDKEVGADLQELRNLQDNPSSESDLRRRTVELENELRQAQNAQRNDRELLNLLTDASQDETRLLATPNRLLEAQPALRRLKEGLVDSQLKSAQLLGGMSEQHPLVKAARASEAQVRQDLHRELGVAIAGVKADLRLTSAREQSLSEQLAAAHLRLERLAGLRAQYGNLAADVKQRTQLLEVVHRDLAAARATQAAAQSANILSRIDTPDAGIRPIGPGTLTLVAGGVFGGLVIGLGILFLSLQPVPAVTSDTDRATSPTIARAGNSLLPSHRPAIRRGHPQGLSFTQALEKANGHNGRWH